MNRILPLAACLFATHVIAAEKSADAASVPSSYQRLYDELGAKLAVFEKQIPSPEAKNPGTTVFSIELTAANANRGETLLTPRARQGVSVNLDAFQALGVTGVTIATSFPVLAADFPHSAEYLAFYKSVADEVRRRGLKLQLKTGAAFVDPVFGHSPAAAYFKKLTPESYITAKRAMIETILRELKPDYLSVDNEPDTTQKNTGLDYSPANYIRYVNAMTKGLERGKTKIAAGAGTWSPLVYFERLARETDVDCIDLHIYPISRDFLTGRLAEAGALAKKYHKSLIVGEAWLYKVREEELGRVDFSYPTIYGRDIFSFWAPLDVRFIGDVGRWSQAQGAELVSFFWAQYLFGYVTYEPALDGTKPAELQALATRNAVPHILAKEFSPSGLAVQKLTAAPR
jgi:hypothetical protein